MVLLSALDSYFPKLCNSLFSVRLQYIPQLVWEISQHLLLISSH